MQVIVKMSENIELNEKKIKDIYKKIGLEAKYQAYEEESYQTIMGLKGSCSQVPWAVFETFLKKVYKRKK